MTHTFLFSVIITLHWMKGTRMLADDLRIGEIEGYFPFFLLSFTYQIFYNECIAFMTRVK